MSMVANVTFAGRPIAAIRERDLPFEKGVQLVWKNEPRLLVVEDQTGQTTAFDFGVVPVDEASSAAMSIRVSGMGAFQADCLLGKETIPKPSDFPAGGAPGMRLQPLLLRDGLAVRLQMRGRGMFDRGLHYPGFVTMANVSLLCLCDDCGASFRLQPFHTGFTASDYFYCETGSHTLIVEHSTGSSLTPAKSVAELERHLPPCAACERPFRYLNPLRCPACRAPYVDFERYPDMRPREYYGHYLHGLPAQVIAASELEPRLSGML